VPLNAANPLANIKMNNVYFLACNCVYGFSIKVLREQFSNIGNMRTVLSYLSILGCIEHGDPIRIGGKKRKGVMICYEHEIVIVSLKFQSEFVDSFLVEYPV
jgi:hypothetical protein